MKYLYLGIGIGLGDGNRISLTESMTDRTDPPAGRTRNRWMLGVDIKYEKVAQVLQASANQPAMNGEGKSGCFGMLILLLGSGGIFLFGWLLLGRLFWQLD